MSFFSVAEDVEVFAGVEEEDGDVEAVGDGALFLGADDEFQGVALLGGDADEETISVFVGETKGFCVWKCGF